jgi:hypothetical protein
MADKPTGKVPSGTDKDRGAGELSLDDRGNVTWQWAENADLQADDAVGRLERQRALDDPGLRVEDDKPDLRAKVRLPPKGPERGYSPYNSGMLYRTEQHKKKDIRALSEWIKLRRKVEKNSGE